MKMDQTFIDGLKKKQSMPENVRIQFEAALSQLPDIPRHRRKRGLRIPTGAAAAAVLLMTVSGGVYAADRLFEYTAQQQGDSIEITANANEDVYIPPITVTANYLPEGYSLCEEGSSIWKYSYGGDIGQNGISISDAGYFHTVTVPDVSYSEQMQIGNASAIINYREGYDFPYQIFLFYTDTGHVINVFGGSDLTKEELIKVCENLTYVESPEKDPDHVYKAFSQDSLIHDTQLTLLSDHEIAGGTTLEPSDIIPLNESIAMTTLAGSDESEHPYTVTIKDIQISDSVDMSSLSEDTTTDLDRVMQYIQDGKLVPFERTVNEWKDKKLQKNTVNTTEVANVSVTMEVANMTDMALDNVNLQPSWKTFKTQEDGTLISCTSIPGYKIDDSFRGVDPYGISPDGYAYYFDSSAFAGTNHFYNMALEPGQTKEVHMSFAIPKDQLDDAYLVFNAVTENHEPQAVKVAE